MAEPLKTKQPSSSVANILKSGAAKAALGDPRERETVTSEAAENADAPVRAPRDPHPTVAVTTEPTGEEADRQFNGKVTETVENLAHELMEAYGQATGLRKLDKSEFLRCLITAHGHALKQHKAAAKKIGPLGRPKKDPSRRHIRDANEGRIIEAMVEAMKAAPRYNPEEKARG